MDHHPHVHFEAADVVAHDNSIAVKQAKEGSIDIHIGFLQVWHKYHIDVPLPRAFLGECIALDENQNQASNLHARVLKIEERSEVVNMTFEVLPQKEKLYREKVTLVDVKDEEIKCVLTLHCRVLGKGKGTPMLKNGIHIVEVLSDPSESENNSDWQGF